jgi:hypothetical protein
MRAIKLFKCLEFDYFDLETRVNAWIAENKVRVVDVKIQMAPQSLGQATNKLGEDSQSDLLCMVIHETE